MFGYGFAVFEDRYATVPEIGLGLSEADREVKVGWRLIRAVRVDYAFDFGVEGRRRTRLDGSEGPEHEIGIGLGWRLDQGQTPFIARDSCTNREENDGLCSVGWEARPRFANPRSMLRCPGHRSGGHRVAP